MMLDIDVCLDKDARMPVKDRVEDAGFILFAREPFTIKPGKQQIIWTGVHMNIPRGYFGLIVSDSDNLRLHGIRCEGVINACCKDEIIIIMHNDGDAAKTFSAGEDAAEILMLPVPDVYFHRTEQVL